MDGLPPFTPDATCPKCGSVEIGNKHFADRTAAAAREDAEIAAGKERARRVGWLECGGPPLPLPYWAMYPVQRGFTLAAHMRRTCTRCGYAWAEAPLDAEEG